MLSRRLRGSWLGTGAAMVASHEHPVRMGEQALPLTCRADRPFCLHVPRGKARFLVHFARTSLMNWRGRGDARRFAWHLIAWVRRFSAKPWRKSALRCVQAAVIAHFPHGVSKLSRRIECPLRLQHDNEHNLSDRRRANLGGRLSAIPLVRRPIAAGWRRR